MNELPAAPDTARAVSSCNEQMGKEEICMDHIRGV